MADKRDIRLKRLNSNLGDVIANGSNSSIPYVDDGEDFSDKQNEENLKNWTLGPRQKSLGERRNADVRVNIVPHDIHVDINPTPTPTPDCESREHPGPLIEIIPITGPGTRGLRRNSISLPAGLDTMDLAALRAAHKAEDDANDKNTDDGESMVCSMADRESIFEEEQKPMMKVKPLRTKRRLSVAPLPSLRLNDKEMIANEFDSQSMISNQNSITSISSLASLLREKMQMFPAMIKKKKKTSEDFKIKAFVGILFLVIVFLVGYAYITYHQQVISHAYYNRVKFSKEDRNFRIFNDKNEDVLTGILGKKLTADKPFHCLSDNVKNDGSVCFEWNGIARLYINLNESLAPIKCYTVKWQALAENVHPTDCFDLGEDHWFGGGLTKNNDWPLSKASFDFEPFITGDARIEQFGNAVKRYFINSRGIAIDVDDKTPLYISMNHNDSKQFCLKAKNDVFAFVNRLTPLPELNYRICTGDNMLDLHLKMTEQSLWDGLKDADRLILDNLLEEPVWQVPTAGAEKMSESAIFNYTEDVSKMGFMKQGHVLINEYWQKDVGDYTLDTERFQTFEETVKTSHRRGFKIVLTVQPFISTESPSFADAVANKLLIYERLSERSIPALTRYKSSTSAGVIDVTNNAAIPWLLSKLEYLKKEYQIDSFYFDFGNAYNMPHYYQCSKTLDNPDQYKSIFLSYLEESVQMIGVTGSVTVPRPPAFLSLPPVNSSWEGLQSIIPTVLTYGVIGFPFILPGAVGGDFLLPANKTKMVTFYSLEEPPLPEEELYIRWMQLATFLPVIRFRHLPSWYKDERVLELVKELTGIRQRIVFPIIMKYKQEAMSTGIPIIRPLWMLDPEDPSCLHVDDEFSVGNDIIVAPILEKGVTKREVYLPTGVWKDGIDGSLRKGNRWIHNYRVEQNKVAYFVKMPDNTRF